MLSRRAFVWVIVNHTIWLTLALLKNCRIIIIDWNLPVAYHDNKPTTLLAVEPTSHGKITLYCWKQNQYILWLDDRRKLSYCWWLSMKIAKIKQRMKLTWQQMKVWAYCSSTRENKQEILPNSYHWLRTGPQESIQKLKCSNAPLFSDPYGSLPLEFCLCQEWTRDLSFCDLAGYETDDEDSIGCIYK